MSAISLYPQRRTKRSLAAKKNLVSNIAGAMSGSAGPKRGEINRQLCHFFRADIGLGIAVAQALGINAEDAMKGAKHDAPMAMS